MGEAPGEYADPWRGPYAVVNTFQCGERETTRHATFVGAAAAAREWEALPAVARGMIDVYDADGVRVPREAWAGWDEGRP